jgi:excisionase family DNA binding protein
MISLIRPLQGQAAQTYIPAKEASKLVGYSKQYLRRLLRQEKLGGIKVGQVWLLEVISINTYFTSVNRLLDKRYGPRT